MFGCTDAHVWVHKRTYGAEVSSIVLSYLLTFLFSCFSTFVHYGPQGPAVMDTKPLPPDNDWRRGWTVPEVDLPPCITSKRKSGERRWFRSENVIPIERYRRNAKGVHPPS